MITKEHYNGKNVMYPDGIGCSIWIPLDDMPDAGICFDFPYEHIDELIELLQELKEAEAVKA